MRHHTSACATTTAHAPPQQRMYHHVHQTRSDTTTKNESTKALVFNIATLQNVRILGQTHWYPSSATVGVFSMSYIKRDITLINYMCRCAGFLNGIVRYIVM
jgi:hypothetical protein